MNDEVDEDIPGSFVVREAEDVTEGGCGSDEVWPVWGIRNCRVELNLIRRHRKGEDLVFTTPNGRINFRGSQNAPTIRRKLAVRSAVHRLQWLTMVLKH